MGRNSQADALIGFLNASPSPYHAVETAAGLLTQAGVSQLAEEEAWKLAPGNSAFVVRGGGSLVALRIPTGFRPDSPLPFHIAAAHTDSPCLRLKPRPAESPAPYRQWGVEVYGGALYNSWLDRDLGLAGRLFRAGAPGGKLIRWEDSPLRIPQLAIHLDRNVNDQGLVLNAQKHLVPLLGMADGPSLESLLESAGGAPLADLAFDLCLYDLTPARYGGLGDAFVHSGRLDNLAMCHAALSAFLAAGEGNAIQVAVLFDHEEVGNVSAHGAASNFLASVLERAALSLGLSRENWLALLPQSLLVSADMAHGLHPNYPEKHEPGHFPVLNRGVVLKANANQRYATSADTAARFLAYARRAGAPVQNFLTRGDLACGTTLGPGLSADLGIPAVDAGTAMLSMHSAREMCGADDSAAMVATLREFFLG